MKKVQKEEAGDAGSPASPAVPEPQPDAWRCFHCGMVLRTEDAARDHFGPTRHDIRACDALTHPAVQQLTFEHWHTIKRWRDTLSDLVDACYTEGSSPAWRLCGVCETEHHREAMAGDQTHFKGCVVDDAEKLLRAWHSAAALAPRTASPQQDATPQVTDAMLKSAALFKKLFRPHVYEDAEGDTLAVRMCKKIYNLTASVKHRGTPLTSDELRTVHSAAFAGLEGPDPDFEAHSASPRTAPAPSAEPWPELLRLVGQWRIDAEAAQAQYAKAETAIEAEAARATYGIIAHHIRQLDMARAEPQHDTWCISLNTALPCDCELAPHRQKGKA